MAWMSEQYIGSDGSRLEFVVHENAGTTKHSQVVNQTFATLTDVIEGVDGVDSVLISQLQITVLPYQVSSITCHNIGTGNSTTTYFYKASKFIRNSYQSQMHVMQC